MRPAYGLLACALLLLGGCGDDPSPGSVGDGQGGSAGSAGAAGSGGEGYGPGPPIVGTDCSVTVEQHPIVPTSHVEECSPLGPDNYNSNPPSSGNHYPIWAAFKTYSQPMPRGYYIHAMEHGAVVFFYNCPEGCPDDAAKLAAVADGLPADPLCTDPAGPQRRLIVVPEPSIPTRFAAAAWGWTMQSPCVDASAFRAFALQHYAQGTENFCNNGVDVIARGIAPGCGQ